MAGSIRSNDLYHYNFYDGFIEKLNNAPNIVLILALLLLFGLAAFMISDIISFGSSPNHHGYLNSISKDGFLTKFRIGSGTDSDSIMVTNVSNKSSDINLSMKNESKFILNTSNSTNLNISQYSSNSSLYLPRGSHDKAVYVSSFGTGDSSSGNDEPYRVKTSSNNPKNELRDLKFPINKTNVSQFKSSTSNALISVISHNSNSNQSEQNEDLKNQSQPLISKINLQSTQNTAKNLIASVNTSNVSSAQRLEAGTSQYSNPSSIEMQPKSEIPAITKKIHFENSNLIEKKSIQDSKIEKNAISSNSKLDAKRLEAKIRQQEAKVKQQDARIKQENAKIKQEEARFNQQNVKYKQQNAKIRQQEAKTKHQEAKKNSAKKIAQKAKSTNYRPNSY